MIEINSPYSQAENEMRSVRAQIAALHKREQKLEAFISLGKELFAHSEPSPSRERVHLLHEAPKDALAKVVEDGRRASMKAQVLNLARQAIQERGTPTHTRELLAYIEAAGVVVTAADKLTAVSVILSRSDDFKSDRTAGWSLTEKNPHDALTSAGSSPA